MVKRVLLIVAATLMLVNTLAMPTIAHADGGGGGGTNCGGNSVCKP